jgi:uncharacterized protein YndB with AHSA1/START domain
MLDVNDKPSNVFVTYIVTTPEKLWAALTQGEITRQYFFGRRMQSDWKPGSPWKLLMEDGKIDCMGDVLECDPPRRLAISWRVEWHEEMRKLPPGKVTYQIDQLGDMVRLTISEFHHPSLDQKYVEGGRKGWPLITSGLKSLLETGHPLPKFDIMKMMQ